MKHAGLSALDRLEDLLAEIRTHAELREKKQGVFYRKSKAFLHFHEDPAGLLADIRGGHDFDRFPVNTGKEQEELLMHIGSLLSDGT